MKFQPGQSGNPAGRPKGSRDAITKDFLKALKEDFDEFGKEAIALAREEDPLGYVKVIAGLIPKDINLNTKDGVFDELSDDELSTIISTLKEHLFSTLEGTEAQELSKLASELH